MKESRSGSDPFYSEENTRHLLKSIAQLKAGDGKPHDLIDDAAEDSFFKPMSKAEVLKILDIAEKQFANGDFVDSEIMEKDFANEFKLKA